MTQSGRRSAIVEMAARLEIQPEVKTSAASLPWRSASSLSSSHDRMAGAGDVARAAGARADARGGLHHRGDHLRVLTHAEIIIGAPDRHIAGRAVVAMPDRLWEGFDTAFEMGEDPVPTFLLETSDRRLEKAPIVHVTTLYAAIGGRYARPSRDRRAIDRAASALCVLLHKLSDSAWREADRRAETKSRNGHKSLLLRERGR